MATIKIEDLERLIDKFRLERIAYLILTLMSVIALMGIGIYLMLSGKGDYKLFLSLFAPTGTLTLSIFRVLKMWDDVLDIIVDSKNDESDDT